MMRGAGIRFGLRCVLGLALVALATGAAASAAADGEGEFKYRMVGRAEGIGFSARRAALEAARQEVIWELLKSKIASGDLRPYRVMVRNAEKYISRTDELHVDSAEDQTRVEIDAIVNIQAFEHDLAAMVKPRLPSPPTIACLIAEQDERGTLEIVDGGLAERSLVEGLDKLELDARDHAETGAELPSADLLAAVSGDLEKASHYARESLADAAVLGIVTVAREEVQDQRGTARTRATLEVRVFRGSDGDMLEVFAHTAAITGNDPEACREESVMDVATKMLGDITVATVLSVLGAQKRDEVLITLLNPGTHRRLELFEGLLAQDGGVHSIEESYFSERSARIRVGYDGSLSYLVDLIGEKTFDGWYVDVQEVIGREMTLIMVPGDGAEE